MFVTETVTGLTHPPLQSISGFISLAVERLIGEDYRRHSSNVEVKEEWRYTSITSYNYMALTRT
jgi:hypothetical protein